MFRGLLIGPSCTLAVSIFEYKNPELKNERISDRFLMDIIHQKNPTDKNPKSWYIVCAMIKTTIKIINKLGLHARASAKFVATAARYQSYIDVTKDSQTVNGKSIMGVMMLAANKGSELTFEIEGPDEIEMNKALVDLVNDYFGEGE